jgi:hypothetical protein
MNFQEFYIAGWQGDEIGKTRKANALFEAGLVLRHLYDSGASSEMDIKIVDVRKGKATSKYPTALLARNQLPQTVCQECGEPEKWSCREC